MPQPLLSEQVFTSKQVANFSQLVGLGFGNMLETFLKVLPHEPRQIESEVFEPLRGPRIQIVLIH